MMVRVTQRDRMAAAQFRPHCGETAAGKKDNDPLVQAFANHVAGMRQQELFDAVIAERNYWQDRAMRVESDLQNMRNYKETSTNLLNKLESWKDRALYAEGCLKKIRNEVLKETPLDGWTEKGKAWLAAGAPFAVEKE